jgi:hypothetical protein
MKKSHVSDEPTVGWERQIDELNFNHLRISKIQKLEPFTSLRKLSLVDNNIS